MLRVALLLLLPPPLEACGGATTGGSSPLRDRQPIQGTDRVYLDGCWRATGVIRTFSAAQTCFNGSAEWLPTPSGFTPDWGTNAQGLCGSCDFEENTDYGDQGQRPARNYDGVKASKMAYSLTPQQCCEVCGADPSCAVAVWSIGHNPWTGSKVGDCQLKPAAALSQKTARANYTAIIPATRSTWQAVSLNATVPGDLITDLQRAGIIADPLFGTNFKNASIWSGDGWNYSTTFALPASFTSPGSSSLLVFEGIKMGARVVLNGVQLGNVSDQHRRYVYPVSKLLRGVNQVSVLFDNTIDMSDGRFMSCSGGWDWAPYSNLRDPQSGLPTFTKGVWKSVYVVGVESTVAAITALVPLVKYTGSDWPIAAMTDGTPSSFEVTTKVFLRSERQVHGVLTVNGSWGASVTQQISLNGGEVQVVIKLRADSPKLWWTRGMGPQAMYNVSAFFQAEAGSAANVSASRRIGFRHLALVTVNDSDASVVAASRSLEGNGNHTLMLRLNGVPVFGKGSNMVPMEALEGRYVSGMHTQIVRSAVEAGMTLLRVWGGGIYPLDEWFDACDEAGVLSMVDMMYGTDGQMPMARATRKLLQISQDFRPYYP